MIREACLWEVLTNNDKLHSSALWWSYKQTYLNQCSSKTLRAESKNAEACSIEVRVHPLVMYEGDVAFLAALQFDLLLARPRSQHCCFTRTSGHGVLRARTSCLCRSCNL